MLLLFYFRYMNLLEEEVYAVHSPIWDLHFKDSDLKKIILSGIYIFLMNTIVLFLCLFLT
jgi:hypothetical protein